MCMIMHNVVSKGEKMKKVLLLLSMVFVTSAADAKIEYYTSMKAGVGDTTIYVHGNTKQGDYLVDVFEENFGIGYKYDSSGLLWEISPAVGIDWSVNNVYGSPDMCDTPCGWFHLRLEGEIGYNNYRENGKLKQNYIVADKIETKYDYLFLLANGYADFRIDKFVPYVGLGLGYALGREEITIHGNQAGLEEFNDSIDDSGIIYALYAGIGYKHSDITTLDLGYRRLYAPMEGDGMNVFSTIRLGARFRI